MIIFHVMNNSDRLDSKRHQANNLVLLHQFLWSIWSHFDPILYYEEATPKYISFRATSSCSFFLQLCPFFSGEALLHGGIFIGRAPVKVAVKARAYSGGEGER